jgi:hypothetical protein
MMEYSPAKPNTVGVISLKIVGEEVKIECCHNSVSVWSVYCGGGEGTSGDGDERRGIGSGSGGGWREEG